MVDLQRHHSWTNPAAQVTRRGWKEPRPPRWPAAPGAAPLHGCSAPGRVPPGWTGCVCPERTRGPTTVWLPTRTAPTHGRSLWVWNVSEPNAGWRRHRPLETSLEGRGCSPVGGLLSWRRQSFNFNTGEAESGGSLVQDSLLSVQDSLVHKGATHPPRLHRPSRLLACWLARCLSPPPAQPWEPVNTNPWRFRGISLNALPVGNKLSCFHSS